MEFYRKIRDFNRTIIIIRAMYSHLNLNKCIVKAHSVPTFRLYFLNKSGINKIELILAINMCSAPICDDT